MAKIIRSIGRECKNVNMNMVLKRLFICNSNAIID